MSENVECWTCDDFVDDLFGCPVGDPDEFDENQIKCGRKYDKSKIKDAFCFALSWAQATLPRSFEEIGEVEVTQAGCFQQFKEFENVYDILSINGEKIAEREAEDEDKSWDLLNECSTNTCDNPLLEAKKKQNFVIRKPTLVEFAKELEVGDKILVCYAPCLDMDGCLPRTFQKPNAGYVTMRLMSMYFLFCNIGNSDPEERAVADKYLNLASNLVSLHYQLKRSQFEESLRYMDRTEA